MQHVATHQDARSCEVKIDLKLTMVASMTRVDNTTLQLTAKELNTRLNKALTTTAVTRRSHTAATGLSSSSTPPPPSTTVAGDVSSCKVRGYQSVGCNCIPGSSCSSQSSNSMSSYNCCGLDGGYCGFEWAGTDGVTWLSVDGCTGLDFLRVSEGCGVEVATEHGGSGARYDYNSSVLLCGYECEKRATPGCDRVRSLRIYHLDSEKVACKPSSQVKSTYLPQYDDWLQVCSTVAGQRSHRCCTSYGGPVVGQIPDSNPDLDSCSKNVHESCCKRDARCSWHSAASHCRKNPLRWPSMSTGSAKGSASTGSAKGSGITRQTHLRPTWD